MRAPRTLLRRNPRRATATERARRPWVALAVSLLLGMGLIGCAAGSSFLPGNLPAVSGGNLVLETRVVVDGVVNRGYLNRIRTGGATLPITSCAITGGALPPGVQARPGSSATPGDPSDDDSCVLIGTPTATGNFTFTLEIRDSSLVSQTVTQSYNLTIRPAFGMTAFQVVDAVAGRSYNNSFKVPTNLSNNPDPDEIGSGERGNGPGAATCTVTGLPANMGFTCNRDASGIAYDVTLTSTGVLAAGGPFNLTISITDSAILQDGEVVVAGGAVTNSTTGTPFALTLTVRPEFSVTSPSPLNVVDAVVGRSYNKTFTFATNLQDNGDDIPNDVNTGEAGNGPLAGGCSINGLPADFNSVCTLDPGDLSGSITITSAGVTTAASTRALSMDLTDSLIPQGAVTVVPAVTRSIPFNLTIRNDFSITATNLVSGTSLPTGVQNSLYDFTLTVTTNTVAGPSEVGQVAENGNGAIAACVVGNLPAGLAQAPPTLLPNGCTIRIQGTPTATGTVSNITLTVTDRPIQQAGLNVVPARSRQQLNISLTVNAPMVLTLVTHAPGGTFNDATSGGVAPDAVFGRTYGAPRRDLLFSVTGGIPPYTWPPATGAPAPIACRQQGANREFFRCDSGGAWVTGATSNLAVSVTDAGSGGVTPQTVTIDNQGHASHTINVRAPLTLNAPVNPPPPGVVGRTYGNVGDGKTPLTYTAAGGIPAPATGSYTFTPIASRATAALPGVPQAVACATNSPATVMTCTSGANPITAAVGTYNFNATVTDTANDTTPAAAAPVSLALSLVVNDVLAITTTQAAFPNGLLFFTYNPPGPGVTLAATGGLGGKVWVAPGAVGAPCPAVGGTLPLGLSVGAASGLVSGVPNSASLAVTDFTFEVCVHDTANATTLAGFDQPPANAVTGGNDYRVNIMGTWAFLAGPGGAGAGGADTVEVIDTVNFLLKTSITLAVGDAPDSVAVTPNGRFAYVTLSGAASIEVIDTITLASVTTINLSAGPDQCGGPLGVAITPDGARAYIACSLNDRVVVINTATNAVLAKIDFGAGDAPDSVAARPDGQRVYVTLNGLNGVAIIDNTATPPVLVPAGGGVVNPFPLPSFTSSSPRGIGVTVDGTLRAYIAKDTSFSGAGEIEVIDVSTDILAAVVPPIDVICCAPPGGAPDSVAMSSVEFFGVNSRVWVTLPGLSGVIQVDNVAVAPITAFPNFTAGGSFGITIPPVDPLFGITPPLVFVAGSGTDTVDVYIDMFGFAPVTSFFVTAGSAPTGMAHIPVPK